MLWTDNKLLTIQAIHNHQNDRIYAVNKDKERIAYERPKSASVMVWAGVTLTGDKTPLIFIEERVKINRHVHLNMLKEQLESGITFQQDGATPHTANLG